MRSAAAAAAHFVGTRVGTRAAGQVRDKPCELRDRRRLERNRQATGHAMLDAGCSMRGGRCGMGGRRTHVDYALRGRGDSRS